MNLNYLLSLNYCAYIHVKFLIKFDQTTMDSVPKGICFNNKNNGETNVGFLIY